MHNVVYFRVVQAQLWSTIYYSVINSLSANHHACLQTLYRRTRPAFISLSGQLQLSCVVN